MALRRSGVAPFLLVYGRRRLVPGRFDRPVLRLVGIVVVRSCAVREPDAHIYFRAVSADGDGCFSFGTW